MSSRSSDKEIKIECMFVPSIKQLKINNQTICGFAPRPETAERVLFYITLINAQMGWKHGVFDLPHAHCSKYISAQLWRRSDQQESGLNSL